MTDDLIELVLAWKTVGDEVAKMLPRIKHERELRKKVVAAIFPTQKEGVNKVALPAGYTLQATCTIDRKVDEAALDAIYSQLLAEGIAVEAIIRRKPELDVKGWRGLSPKQQRILASCITSTPATPTLEIIPPKSDRR